MAGIKIKTFITESKLGNYDVLELTYFKNDKKYIIHGLGGAKFFPNSIKDCRNKQDEVLNELKTIFVEHEIQEREVSEDDKGYPILNIDLCGTDWVVDCCNEVHKMDPKVTREQVEEVMDTIGFGNSKKKPDIDYYYSFPLL